MTALDSAENRKKLGKESNGERRPGTTKMTIGTRKKGKLSLSLLLSHFSPFFRWIISLLQEGKTGELRNEEAQFRFDRIKERGDCQKVRWHRLISFRKRLEWMSLNTFCQPAEEWGDGKALSFEINREKVAKDIFFWEMGKTTRLFSARFCRWQP